MRAALEKALKGSRQYLRFLVPQAALPWFREGRELGKDMLALIKAARAQNRSLGYTSGTPCYHVLIIDDLVPDPLFGFGFPRVFAMVKSLVRSGHRVSVYPMWSSAADLQRMDALFGKSVRFHRGEGERGLRRLLWVEGADVDLLFISRPRPMRAFVDAGWTPAVSPLVVYDAEAVITPREGLRRTLFGLPWSAQDEASALAAEFDAARHAQLVTAVSASDAKRIAALLHVPVLVLSHPVTAQPSSTGFTDRRDLLFIGRLSGAAETYPNVDSVLWFVKEVMPLLDRLIGATYALQLVGLVESPAIQDLASDRVIVHGSVDNLSPFYDGCRLFVAPTRYAAGVPLKVIETMGQGLPCVTTPLLAEQLNATGHGFAREATAQAFAERCARLYSDPVAWCDAREYGVEHARQFFSQKAFDDVLEELLSRAPIRKAD